MSKRPTDRFHELARPVWEAQRTHPFILGIADGTLAVEKFRFWVRQDYLFLVDYSSVLAYAAARAPDLEATRRFAELTHSTLTVEMDLHRAYAAQFGISGEELEAEQKAPSTQAYTDFLLRLASTGHFSELASGLLPCMWGYSDLGRYMARGARPPDERYAAWIDMYSSDEFAKLAEWCRSLVDRLAFDAPLGILSAMEDAFLTSSRYELLFWEMAWRQERWQP